MRNEEEQDRAKRGRNKEKKDRGNVEKQRGTTVRGNVEKPRGRIVKREARTKLSLTPGSLSVVVQSRQVVQSVRLERAGRQLETRERQTINGAHAQRSVISILRLLNWKG